jgi:hypothetical protein
MTEADWNSCDDPGPMLKFLRRFRREFVFLPVASRVRRLARVRRLWAAA